MSTDEKIFQFVSKLIFDTNAGEIRWNLEDNNPNFSGLGREQQMSVTETFSAPTPDHKQLQFVYTEVQGPTPATNPVFTKVRTHFYDYQLELLNKGKVELFLDYKSVNSLKELYKAIRRQMYDITPAAEQTIDLILNSSSETAQH